MPSVFGRRTADNNSMRPRARPLRGTTLAELLVATVFLGLCAAPLVAATSSANRAATYASRRLVIMAAIDDQFNLTMAAGRSDPLTVGSTKTSVAVFGGVNVQLTTTIQLATGYSDVYLVTVSADWNEPTRNDLADSMSFSTYIRAPDA